MDRQSFVSTKPKENIKKYVIGMLQDKEIHASPITGIYSREIRF